MKREEFFDKLHSQLHRWDVELDELEVKLEDKAEKARSAVTEKLTSLKGKREALAKKVDRLKALSDTAFKDVQNLFENAWTELKSGIVGSPQSQESKSETSSESESQSN